MADNYRATGENRQNPGRAATLFETRRPAFAGLQPLVWAYLYHKFARPKNPLSCSLQVLIQRPPRFPNIASGGSIPARTGHVVWQPLRVAAESSSDSGAWRSSSPRRCVQGLGARFGWRSDGRIGHGQRAGAGQSRTETIGLNAQLQRGVSTVLLSQVVRRPFELPGLAQRVDDGVLLVGVGRVQIGAVLLVAEAPDGSA